MKVMTCGVDAQRGPASKVVGLHSRVEPAMGSGAVWEDAWWGVDLQVLHKRIVR